MPFTIGGDYLPPEEKPEKKSGRPVKVRLEKRKKAILTVVINLERPDLKEIASTLKSRLGCGGSVKDGRIEIQGDKVPQVKELLLEFGIKSS
jgi:translation initiation factor 1